MAYKALVANVLKWQPEEVRRMKLMSDVQIGDAALVGTAPKRLAVQPRRLVTMSPAYRKIMVAETKTSVYDDVRSQSPMPDAVHSMPMPHAVYRTVLLACLTQLSRCPLRSPLDKCNLIELCAVPALHTAGEEQARRVGGGGG